MKINFFAVVSCVSAGLVAGTWLHAQSNMQISADVTSYAQPMSHHASRPIYRNDIPVRAVRHFLMNFSKVLNESWYKGQDRFVATFVVDSIDWRVDYDLRGFWIQTFRTYGETKMPIDVRQIVKSSYYDYNIFQVQELETARAPLTYFIHLEGKTKLINLKVTNGQMEEWQDFDKSE